MFHPLNVLLTSLRHLALQLIHHRTEILHAGYFAAAALSQHQLYMAFGGVLAVVTILHVFSSPE